MKKKDIIGVVIIYKFEIDNLIDNINQYLFSIDKLVIWQNSLLSDYDKEKLSNIKYSNKIEILGNGENKGISFAINTVINKYNQEYEFLMTMDQDSYWINIADYIENIKQIDKENALQIYGPNIIPMHSFKSETYKVDEEAAISYVDHVITSGAVYKMDIFKFIGNMKEDFFIDAIDEEICYRAQKNNINTIKINKGVLLQTFGEPHKYRLLFKEVTYNKYSAERLYYIVRNHIRLVREYNFSIRKSWLLIYSYVIRPIIMIVLFDEFKIKKLTKIYFGIIDGFKS